MIEGLRAAEARIAAIQARFGPARWEFVPGFEPAYRNVGLTPGVSVADPTTDVGVFGVDGDATPLTGDVATGSTRIGADPTDETTAATQQRLLGATYGVAGSTLDADDGAWIRRLPEVGQPWAGAIADAARANGLEPELLSALVWTESTFDPDAVSPAGATGLTQLMPDTAARLGVDPTLPLDALAGGARELRRLLDDADGRLAAALAAYHAGPATGFGPRDGWPNSTIAYVDTVLERRDVVLGQTAGARP